MVLQSRLDHCNAIVVSLPLMTLSQLQRVLNMCKRAVLGMRLGDYVIAALWDTDFWSVGSQSNGWSSAKVRCRPSDTSCRNSGQSAFQLMATLPVRGQD